MNITVDQIMSWRPCSSYPRERVECLIGEGKTLQEFAALDIPTADRVWGFIQLMDERQRRLFAVACARDVLPIYEAAYPGDVRVREAIDIADRYAYAAAAAAANVAKAEAAANAVYAAYAASAAYDAAKEKQVEIAVAILSGSEAGR